MIYLYYIILFYEILGDWGKIVMISVILLNMTRPEVRVCETSENT